MAEDVEEAIAAERERKQKIQSIRISDAIYREFGKITGVDHEDGYLTLVNEHGDTIHMIKRYAGWVRQYQLALKFKESGREIIYEKGVSAAQYHGEYFRNIIPESPHVDILSQRIFGPTPDDCGDEGKKEIIRWRIRARDAEFRYDEERNENANYRGIIENRTVAEQKAAEKASKKLDQHWSTFEHKQVTLKIIGQAHSSSKHPKHPDIVFATRLGIDVTKMRQIGVEVKGRVAGKNQIYARLLAKGLPQEECVLTIIPNTTKNTQNEWAIASVDNQITGWFDVENKHFTHWKSQLQPIEYFLQGHAEALNMLIDGKFPSSTLDVAE